MQIDIVRGLCRCRQHSNLTCISCSGNKHGADLSINAPRFRGLEYTNLIPIARSNSVVMIRAMSQGRKIKKPFGKRGDPNWMDTIPLTPEFLNRSKVHVRKYGKVRTDLPPAAK
jgi:hypothetical protein